MHHGLSELAVEYRGLELRRRVVWNENRKPRSEKGNREKMIDRILGKIGIPALYEPYYYELNLDRAGGQVTSAYQPDFWLPAANHRPAMHIEVVCLNANKHPEGMSLKKDKALKARIIYGIDTLLIDRTMAKSIAKDSWELLDLINRMAARHSTAAA